MTDDRETCVERIQNDKYTNIYTSERKFINELNALKKQYPDDVIIEHVNRDGSICAKVPYNWFRFVKPVTKRNMTDEQRKAASERMKKARENKKGRNYDKEAQP